jgi:hypothetical protein
MLTRRQMLLASATTVSAAGIGIVPALALSTEPMPPADAQAMALACGAAASHAELVAEARLMLDGEVKQGLLPANYDTTIVCPFCRCSLKVAPDVAF